MVLETTRQSRRFGLCMLLILVIADLWPVQSNKTVSEPVKPVVLEQRQTSQPLPEDKQQGKQQTSVLEQDKPQLQQAEIVESQLAWYEQHDILTKLVKNEHPFVVEDVVATGYYAGVESTGKTVGHPQYGITYSGVKTRRAAVSTIAADLKVFPLGTLLYIPGYGYGIVADIGSAIKGNKIDLFFNTKKQVYSEWGKKKINVTVLKRGDGKVTEFMLDRLNEALKGSTL